MYETGRRAHRAQVLCPQRLDWSGSVLPDSREDFELGLPLEAISDDASEPPGSWFKVKSYHGFQHLSIVLVEKIVRRDDVEDESCLRHLKQKHLAPVSKSEFGKKDPQCATTPHDHQIGERSTSLRDSIPVHRIKKKRTHTTNNLERVVKADWRHGTAESADTGGARTIDEGLQNDGLGHISDAASSLAVIRRMELDAEGFFEFLFSDRWKKGCLLRVLRGKLLDDLLHTLNQLQKSHDVVCYSTMAYTHQHSPLVPCNKMHAGNGRYSEDTLTAGKSVHARPIVKKNSIEHVTWCVLSLQHLDCAHQTTQETPDVVEHDVLVEVDCFHPRQRPEAVKQQSHMSDPLGTVMFESHISDPAVAVSFQSHTSDPARAVSFQSHASNPARAVSFQSHASNPARAVPFKSLMLNPQRVVGSQFTSLEVLPSLSYRSDPTEASSQCQSFVGPGLSQSVISDQPAAFTSPSVLSDPLGAVASPSLWSNPPGAVASPSVLSDPPGAVTSSSLLLDQPEAVKSWSRVMDRPGAVVLQSPLLSSLEALPSQSYRSDPTETSKCQSIYDATAVVPRQSETVGIACNIRGLLKPPPHSDCFSPYHAVREPFQLRRHRQQSSLPPHTLPRLCGPCLSGTVQSEKSEDQQSQDYAFLGSRFEDSTEPVTTDVFLTPISQMLKEGWINNKTQQNGNKSSPAKEKTAKKKKGKKNKKGEQNHASDEDSDTLEDTQVRSWIDPSRVDRLKKDIEWMSTELMAKQPVPKRKKEAIQARLRRELGILREKRLQDASTKEAAVKQMEQATMGKPAGQSAQGSSATRELPTVYPPLMRQWSRCPTLAEFHLYLESEKGKEKKCVLKRKAIKPSPKPVSLASKTDAEINLALAENSKKTTNKLKEEKRLAGIKFTENKKGIRKHSESDAVTGSPAVKVSQTKKEKKNKSDSKQNNETTNGFQTLEQEVTGKKGIQKQNGQNGLGWRKQNKTRQKIMDDTPYVYISDSEIPDNITQSDLFCVMQVDKCFNPQKLKSSYSFERMFAHRSDQIPNYAKLLSMYSKPFKKTSKTTPKRKSLAHMKSQESAQSEATNNEMTSLSPLSEPSSPSMILGKLKDFKFLQHRNYVPNPVSTPGIPDPQNQANISELLVMAMQKFVMRKERTTCYSPYQCRGKVSVTFSKRADDLWLGVPPLRQPCSPATNQDS